MANKYAGTQTEKNLEAAFAGESQARNKYTYFASVAKKAGYEICAVFVLTKDAKINVERVKARAAAGGHDVPSEKVISRYQKSLKNLSQLVRIADMTRVVDNTGDTPALICEVKGNSAQIWETEFWSKADILRLLA